MGQDELAVSKPDPAQAKDLGLKQRLETGREVGHTSFQPAALYFQRKAILTQNDCI